jgi:uncharacterized damage-inducible protein DinB
MTTIRSLAVSTILALGALAPDAAFAQVNPLRDELLKDWTEMRSIIGKIAAEMPADKYGFRPTPAQRTYAGQVMHIATSNVIGIGTLGSTIKPPALDRNAAAKADVLAALEQSFDYGDAVLRTQTDKTMLETIEAVRYLGPSTRARAVWFLLGHSWDIYGQMAVYLRLNGLVPPASQRP